ncbi:MAG: helix-turn-helix domain-containing protein [Hyphomicrobiaceae bacterium]|nr:helix-turn-helix domain-containing protein [Hyphomicrobiaceae bacterium]
MLAHTQASQVHSETARAAAAALRGAQAAPSTLEGHLSRAPLRSFAAKEHVFTEGDARTNLYRLESGAVCLYKVMPDGRRQVLGFAYAGDLIGLGSSGEHQFNAQATKPAELRILPWSLVQRIARNDPEFGFKLYEAAAQELAAAHDLLLTTGQRTAMESLAAFLMAMARRGRRAKDGHVIIDLPMTRSDIGDFLGLTIETVSRTFTKLRQLRIIDLAQCTQVHVLDMDALEDLAQGESA